MVSKIYACRKQLMRTYTLNVKHGATRKCCRALTNYYLSCFAEQIKSEYTIQKKNEARQITISFLMQF